MRAMAVPTPPIVGRRRSLTLWAAGASCFGLVFGAGFVFGTLRVLWLVPRLGERAAELIEMPLMLAVILFAARFVLRRTEPAPRWPVRLGIGLVALALLLAAEGLLLPALSGRSLADALAGRDPVSGTVTLVMLGVFAAMPVLLPARKRLRPGA